MDIFINASLEPFRHSYKGMPAPLRGNFFSIRDVIKELKENRKEQRKFYSLLVNLKRDGLIVRDGSGKKGFWMISKRGENKLEEFINKVAGRYTKQVSDGVIVISYDIPEKHKSDRNWLRSVLKLLDYKMLHQSVWIGKINIPNELLMELRERGVVSFVHIFTIGKEGSLSQFL